MRRFKILLALVLGSFATAANAASWPNRPIHLIVPYPPGGGTDLLARVIGAQLEKSLGQAVIIDNRPGGSTVIGTSVLANAAPDGYTVGMVFDSLAINSVLGVQTSYDPEKDFVPIIKLAYVPLVLTVNSEQVPMKTLPERYQKVVFLYYTNEMTMKEIGGILGINESRVSQIHKSALEKMQVVLQANGIDSVHAF